MRKILTIVLVLLLVGCLLRISFASVGAQVSGSSVGTATDINVQSGITGSSDGSTFTITSTPKGVSALTASGTITVNLNTYSVYTLTPVIPTTLQVLSGTSGGNADMVFTAGGTRGVVTLYSGFKSTGTLDPGSVSGKVSIIRFINDGINWNETGRVERY